MLKFLGLGAIDKTVVPSLLILTFAGVRSELLIDIDFVGAAT